jgi:hypothetical protein
MKPVPLKSMKDFVGKSVEVGDYIFYSTTGRDAESRICRVSRFTAKSMFVDIIKRNRHGAGDLNVVVRNDFIKIDYTP